MTIILNIRRDSNYELSLKAQVCSICMHINLFPYFCLSYKLLDICINDIVTNVTVTLSKGGMLEKSTSTLASKNISLTNVFAELMEDQNYTIDLFFSVFRKENVVGNFSNFGTVLFNYSVFVLFFSSFRHLWSAVT